MNRLATVLMFLAVVLPCAVALAFPVRCYNKDGKRYQGTFVCKGNVRRSVEIRPGTTTISTQASGPCELKLGGSSVTLDKGDKVEVKGGSVRKL